VRRGERAGRAHGGGGEPHVEQRVERREVIGALHERGAKGGVDLLASQEVDAAQRGHGVERLHERDGDEATAEGADEPEQDLEHGGV